MARVKWTGLMEVSILVNLEMTRNMEMESYLPFKMVKDTMVAGEKIKKTGMLISPIVIMSEETANG